MRGSSSCTVTAAAIAAGTDSCRTVAALWATCSMHLAMLVLVLLLLLLLVVLVVACCRTAAHESEQGCHGICANELSPGVCGLQRTLHDLFTTPKSTRMNTQQASATCAWLHSGGAGIPPCAGGLILWIALVLSVP